MKVTLLLSLQVELRRARSTLERVCAVAKGCSRANSVKPKAALARLVLIAKLFLGLVLLHDCVRALKQEAPVEMQ